MKSSVRGRCAVLVAAAGVVVHPGCNSAEDAPGLSKASAENVEIPEVPVPAADGPRLGAIADVTPILDRPSKNGAQIGYLHAGASVPRADEPFSTTECEGGWYPIRPRGFVCIGDKATLDLQHPTMVAMALQPKLDQALPHTYARVRKTTTLFERDADRKDAVRAMGTLRSKSALAIVGSWSAELPEGGTERLGLLTNGRFAKAADLQAAEPSAFKGVDVGEQNALPIGYVVKRGVRSWRIDKTDVEKGEEFDYHQMLPLTGRFREIDNLKYWAMADGRYARHRDVTVLRRRNDYPDFATGDQKWIDVSIVTGTVVLYEGKKPVFATLVSVGRDRLGDPKETASTAQGTHTITGKHVTATQLDPKGLAEFYDVYDAPWTLELSSGQLIHGAVWHDRFGIEHGPGNVMLSPADAQRVWQWADPEVPEGWHGVNQAAGGTSSTVVVIRK